MVAVPGKVGLARHTDADCVSNIAGRVCGTAVVAVGLVVAGADHVGLIRCDWGHLIVEVVEDRFIDYIAIRNGCVRQKPCISSLSQ